jgi:transposase
MRMYRDLLRDHSGESELSARRHVGGLLDINPATIRNWIDREQVDAGERPGVTSEASAELKALRKENPSSSGRMRSCGRRRRVAPAEVDRRLG